MEDQMQTMYPSLFAGWGQETWYGGLVFCYCGLVFSYGGLVFYYDDLVFSYVGLIYDIWCFYICLDMMTNICLKYVLVYDLAYVLISIFMVTFLYVPMCMDVNTVTSCVIKLQYVVWVSCHYGYVIMLSCYHVVMLSWCYDVIWIGTHQDDQCKYHNELWYKALLSGMLSCCHDVLLLSQCFIVNTTSSCVIKLHKKYSFFK